MHDPGKIIADLMVTLALGGDCLADIAVLRAQPELAGVVAPGSVVSRLISALAADAPRALKAIRRARGAARERARALAGDRVPGGAGSLIPVDTDATIVTAPCGTRTHAPCPGTAPNHCFAQRQAEFSAVGHEPLPLWRWTPAQAGVLDWP